MDSITDNPVIQLLGRHRSVRRYTDKPIPAAMLDAVVRAGQGAAGGQPWIEQAAEFLVFCADLRRVDAACRKSGAGALEGWTEHSLAAIVDTALMAGQEARAHAALPAAAGVLPAMTLLRA